MAGITYIADSLLQNPKAWESEPAIRRYEDAMKSDNGRSLTISEMKDLAVQLALQTAKKERGVGGPNQIAILQKGPVVSIDQGTYPPPPKMLFDFALWVSSLYEFDVTGFFNSESKLPNIKTSTGDNGLFVKCLFSRVRVDVDSNYFSGDVFITSIFTYDGIQAMHFGGNVIKNCILIIGPYDKRSSKQVKHLVNDFSWLQVVYQESETKGRRN
jgi:hypothetical protein